MIPFPLKLVPGLINGLFHGDAALLENEITDIVIDSRKVKAGALYVPIVGDVHDGHNFIQAARHNGALCVLTEKPLDKEPYILVENSVDALQRLARYYREQFPIPVIGITGSVGKTSTKDMIATVLSKHYKVYKTPGNLNNQTGVPQAIFGLSEDDELAVFEMGTNHPGEIRRLTAMVQPTIAVLTNIGVAHIEFFGTRENIFRGKAEILESLRPGGSVIVNGDDDMLIRLHDTIRCGFQSGNDYRAEELREEGLAGSFFTVQVEGQPVSMHVPAPGKHMVSNALVAIAVGRSLGLPLNELIEGVESFRPAQGRMLIHNTGRYTVIDDSYNANPNSVMAAIDVLEKTPGRHVCILGDMLELGAQSEEFHEVVGMYAALHHMDLIVCVGPNSEQMFMGAIQFASRNSRYFETQENMLDILPMLLRDGDTILVKASRGMHLEDTVHKLLEL